MKRSRLMTVLGVVLVMAVLATPVFAQEPNPGSGSTDVTVMNTDGTNPAAVTAEYFNPDGTSAGTRSQNLNAMGSYQFLAADSGLPDNWKGSMVVSSSTDLAAVATIQWSGGSFPDGVEADSYSGFTSGSTSMYLPFAVYAPAYQYTIISVQNTESVAANITMRYYNRDGVLDFTINDSIPANGQKMYDLHTPGPQIPVWTNSAYFNTNGNWTGAVVITTGAADQKIAAVATNHWAQYSVAYNGASAGATKVFIPSVERRLPVSGDPNDLANWLGFSVIIVQNLGTNPTQLTFRFVNKDTGNVDLTLPPITLAAGAAVGCNTRAGGAGCVSKETFNALTNPWVGSVIVDSSSENVAAIAYSIRPRDNEAGSTTGASAANAGTHSYLAEIYQIGPAGDLRTLWSLLRLQNVTTSQATVNLEFRNRDGTVALTLPPFTIDGEKSRNFNLRDDSQVDLPENFSGAAHINSTQPLAVVVENLWGLARLAAYNGYSK